VRKMVAACLQPKIYTVTFISFIILLVDFQLDIFICCVLFILWCSLFLHLLAFISVLLCVLLLLVCVFFSMACFCNISVMSVFVENFVLVCFYVEICSYCERCGRGDVRCEWAIISFTGWPNCSSLLRLMTNETCLANCDFNVNFVIVVIVYSRWIN